MIIDFHTHTFPDRIAARTIEKLAQSAHLRRFSDGTETMLARSMKKAGIGLSIVLPVATSVNQVEHINLHAAQINAHSGDSGIFSFGCMHPDHENYRQELRNIKRLGLKGIKIHPVYQQTDLDDVRYLRIFEEAAALDLIVTTHTGFDVGFPEADFCTPQMARHVMDEIGKFHFVAAHMGGIGSWAQASELLAGTGIFLDSSFSLGRMEPSDSYYWSEERQQLLTEEAFTEMVRLFGAEHILFGTDSPWADQAKSVCAIQSLPLSEEEKELILCRNALRLLRESAAVS